MVPISSCSHQRERGKEKPPSKLTGVFKVAAKVDRADDIGVLVVNRLPLEMLLVEFEDMADIVVREVDVLVLHLGFALGPDKLARQLVFVLRHLGVVHSPIGGILGLILPRVLGFGCRDC